METAMNALANLLLIAVVCAKLYCLVAVVLLCREFGKWCREVEADREIAR